MTSPSLKKRPITLRNKRGSIIKRTLGALALSAMLSSGWLSAGEPLFGRRTPESKHNHVRLVGLEEESQAPALERLKDRSPESRWNGLKQNSGSTGQARPLPVESHTDSIPLRTEPRGLYESTTPRFPAQPRDQVPMLPDVSEFGEFQTAPARQSVSRVAIDEDPLRSYEETLAPPDAIRPLSTIQPYHDFQGSSKNPFDLGTETPGIDVGRVPEEKVIPSEPYQPRLSPDVVFSWEASNLWHNPLWFEDPALERYGHVAHPLLQPFISTGRMTTQFLGLPYQATIDPYHKQRYTLGWYRPGECAPAKFYQVPFNWDAAAVQAGAVTAGVFILP